MATGFRNWWDSSRAVVKDLIEAHNGMVAARIEGDEFQIWFSLPRVR